MRKDPNKNPTVNSSQVLPSDYYNFVARFCSVTEESLSQNLRERLKNAYNESDQALKSLAVELAKNKELFWSVFNKTDEVWAAKCCGLSRGLPVDSIQSIKARFKNIADSLLSEDEEYGSGSETNSTSHESIA